MRIAVVSACPFPSPQGSQVFVGEMCDALAQRGHVVELLTYGQRGAAGASSNAYVHRCIRRLPGDDALRSGPTLVKPALDVLLAAELSRMLARDRFDIVHAHNYEAAAVAVATRVLRGVPVVYHSHSVMAEELPTYFESRVAKRAAALLGAAFDRTVPRGADHAIALSRNAASALRAAGLGEDDVSIVPPALADVGEPRPRDAARGSLGLPPERFVVGYCGNLDAYQDLDLVAVAIARMGVSTPALAPLWLVVTHALDRRFERMLERSGAASWTRVVVATSFAEARQAMAACDAMVLPRRTGSGFPIKLLNYMAVARPVVVGPGAEGLLEHGCNGVVAAGADPAGWVAALEKLRCEPAAAEALGGAARRTFLDDFTWDATLPAIERAYEKAIGHRRTASAVVPVLR